MVEANTIFWLLFRRSPRDLSPAYALGFKALSGQTVVEINACAAILTNSEPISSLLLLSANQLAWLTWRWVPSLKSKPCELRGYWGEEEDGGGFRWMCLDRRIKNDWTDEVKRKKAEILSIKPWCKGRVKAGGACQGYRALRGWPCISWRGPGVRHDVGSLSQTCVGNLYRMLGCRKGYYRT